MKKTFKKLEFRNVVIILCVVLSLVGIIYTIAKYVISDDDTHIQRAEASYFDSTTLSTTNPEYTVNNWNVTAPYEITIDLKNFEDTKRSSTRDISYQVAATTSNSKVNVSTSIQTGTITVAEKQETVTVTVTLNDGQTLAVGETIPISVVVTSTTPYKKELKAVYNLSTKNYSQLDTNLVDSQGAKYATLYVTANEKTTKMISWNTTSCIFENTGLAFKDVNITSEGTESSVPFTFESDKSYVFYFIKKDESNVTSLGTDIKIN